MKKIFKQILPIALASCALSFTACDDMLETKNFTDMTADNFFNTEGDIKAAVTGLYVPCTTNWGYSDGGTGGWYNAIFNADNNAYYPCGMTMTDIMRHYSSNIYDEFNFGPSSGGPIKNTYNVIRFVARATDVINNIGKSKASDAVKERYVAEVKTLRAFYMYVLLDWFGPVNVKLDPETLMDNTITARPTNEEYVGYIEKDLNEAIACENFPDKYNDDEENWGRMSKAVAYGVRMELYMHEKNWKEAKAAAQQLMGMGYELLDNYEDVFNIARNAEQVWSIPANTSSDNFYVTEVLPSDFKRGYNSLGESYMRGNDTDWKCGWQSYCMYWDYYDTFEASDVRKNTILVEYDTNDGSHKGRGTGMVGPIPIKFTDSQFSNYGIQKEHPVIRYAEVLLSYAEAENELNGPTASAIAAVKQVTDRAHVSIPADATASKEAFRSYLLVERGHELFCEGHRRQDLIRHGEFIKRAQERGYNAQSYHVLMPIPQNVITEANGIIEQNAGYTK